jgi:hypothetical protein
MLGFPPRLGQSRFQGGWHSLVKPIRGRFAKFSPPFNSDPYTGHLGTYGFIANTINQYPSSTRAFIFRNLLTEQFAQLGRLQLVFEIQPPPASRSESATGGRSPVSADPQLNSTHPLATNSPKTAAKMRSNKLLGFKASG